MGTGAVYVTLSGLKEHTEILTDAETYFYFLNMFFFLLNTITLALQAMRTSDTFDLALKLKRYAVYPRQALRLITDPVKGVFVPLIVRISYLSSSTHSVWRDRFYRMLLLLSGPSIMLFQRDTQASTSFTSCIGVPPYLYYCVSI